MNQANTEPTDRHWVRWDEPSGRSRRSRRAVCGKWISPKEDERDSERVTCPDCAEWIAEFNALEVGP